MSALDRRGCLFVAESVGWALGHWLALGLATSRDYRLFALPLLYPLGYWSCALHGRAGRLLEELGRSRSKS